MRGRGRHTGGMTILEVVIVIALIGLVSYLGVGAIRWLRGANAVETTVEMAAVMRRTSQLAQTSGELYRVVFDLGASDKDPQSYRVEVCSGGPAALSKVPEPPEQSEEAKKRAVEDAKQRLSTMAPQGALPTGGGEDEGRAEEMALALAGQLGARRMCTVSVELFGDPDGKGAVRPVLTERGARIRQVWVQHLEEPVSHGLVAVYFFPSGSAEKAILEVGDGRNTFTLLVYGLTGRVEVRDGALRDPDDFLLRDATGEEVEP
jgi:type II secretory pathway pseudopilin PulG